MTKAPNPTKTKGVLAEEIAKAFKEEERTQLFEHIFEKYDAGLIQGAFDEVKQVPAEKIRKSRSALFFYLLDKYGEE